MPEMRERALRKGPGNSGVLRSGGACSEGGTALTEASARLLAASAFLWTAAVPDLRTKKIPLWIPAVFLPAALAADLFFFTAPAADLFPTSVSGRRELWAGAVPGAALLLLSFLSRGKVGEGDGICLVICGLFAGLTKTVLIAETALLSAAAAGAFLLLTKQRRPEDRLPFVPFLAAASTLVLLLSG